MEAPSPDAQPIAPLDLAKLRALRFELAAAPGGTASLTIESLRFY